MSDISGISATGAGRVVGASSAPGRDTPAPQDSAPLRRGTDRVEVSALATYLSKLRQLPAVRQSLIDSVRAQIENGTYDTPEKIDAALDQMLREEQA